MKYKVLVVDDEYLIKKSLHKMISESEHGFTAVAEAEDGREALELAAAIVPDLIITDLSMPVMDGLELIKECRNRNLLCKIVILSGYAEFEFAQQAMRYGVIDYLLKPIQPEQLNDVLLKVREKLDSSQKVLRETTGLLQYCLDTGSRLASLIWDLDEIKIRDELTGVCLHYADQQADSSLYKHLCFELLSQIEKQLRQLGAAVSHTDLAQFQAASGPAEAMRLLEATVTGYVQDLVASRNHSTHNSVKLIMAHIEHNYMNEDISLQKIAEQMKISVSYASQLFKEVAGESFVHYLTRIRMEKAKELLRNPDCKTYEAALAVGYNDYSHFTKTFKKYFGVSPKDYRSKRSRRS